jgi:hypothetical protein
MRVSTSGAFRGTVNPRAAGGSSVSVKSAAVTFVTYVTDRTEHSPSWVSNSLQHFKKFPAFNGIRRFITAFRRASRESLSWASSIQSMPPLQFLWRSILKLFTRLRLGLLFHSSFPTKTSCGPVLSPVRATCLVLHILSLIARIFRSEYRSWSCSLFSSLRSPATSAYFGPNIFLNTPLSNTFSLCSSLNVRSQVSHP